MCEKKEVSGGVGWDGGVESLSRLQVSVYDNEGDWANAQAAH